jgi:hypothetical protein
MGRGGADRPMLADAGAGIDETAQPLAALQPSGLTPAILAKRSSSAILNFW